MFLPSDRLCSKIICNKFIVGPARSPKNRRAQCHLPLPQSRWGLLYINQIYIRFSLYKPILTQNICSPFDGNNNSTCSSSSQPLLIALHPGALLQSQFELVGEIVYVFSRSILPISKFSHLGVLCSKFLNPAVTLKNLSVVSFSRLVL